MPAPSHDLLDASSVALVVCHATKANTATVAENTAMAASAVEADSALAVAAFATRDGAIVDAMVEDDRRTVSAPELGVR